MTFRLGLTGSIGMGKSTTAKLFAEAGCDVWDADAAVHRLYSSGGAAVQPMSVVFPEAVEGDTISRPKLRLLIQDDPARLREIEQIVHPLVAADREEFAKKASSDVIVFDIPLLFETGGNARMDAVVTVSVPAETQRKRVVERGQMTKAQFEAILAKQMPDQDKQDLSDYVIYTDTIDHARQQVENILKDIQRRIADA